MNDQIRNKGHLQKKNGKYITIVRCCLTKSNEENENIVFQLSEAG